MSSPGEVRLGRCMSWLGLVFCDDELTPGARLVATTVDMFTSPIGEMAWPTKEAIVQLTKMKLTQVEKALEELRTAKFLKYVRLADHAIYIPTFPQGRGFSLPEPWQGEADSDKRVVFRANPEEATKIAELLGLTATREALVVFCGGSDADKS